MLADSLTNQLVFLGLVSAFAANWPFFRAGGTLAPARVAMELILGFIACLLLAVWLESRFYVPFEQQPVFYIIITLLFLALAFPGFVYRIIFREKFNLTQQDDTHLTEIELSSRALPVGKHFHWIHSEVKLPDGTQASREYLNHPGAVMILPMMSNQKIVFERQYRHPGKQVFLELPAGKLHAGEDKQLCAYRELLEETGYQAEKLTYLGKTCPAIGYSDEEIHIFLAESLTFKGQSLDEGEFIETVEMTLSEAIDGVLNGSIVDAKTIAGIFWLAHYPESPLK